MFVSLAPSDNFNALPLLLSRQANVSMNLDADSSPPPTQEVRLYRIQPL